MHGRHLTMDEREMIAPLRAAFLDLEAFSLAEIAEATAEDHWLKRYLADPDGFTDDPPERVAAPRTVYEQLWWGFLPRADSLAAEWVGDFHRAYLRTYIERDARLMSDVTDWQQFGRFVRLAAALTAQEVNHSQFGREVGVTPRTAQRWLATLQATFQWFEVPAYHGNTVKRIRSKPKGYLADTGVACTLQMVSTPQTLGGHPLASALFETAVVAEVRKLAASLAAPPALYHWRSHGGAEVDLLLERDGRFYPIEVRLGTRPSRGDTRGITALRQTYPDLPVAPGLVTCPTDRPHRRNDTDFAIPWDVRQARRRPSTSCISRTKKVPGTFYSRELLKRSGR